MRTAAAIVSEIFGSTDYRLPMGTHDMLQQWACEIYQQALTDALGINSAQADAIRNLRNSTKPAMF